MAAKRLSPLRETIAERQRGGTGSPLRTRTHYQHTLGEEPAHSAHSAYAGLGARD